jgi:hypothetical protein
MLDPQPTGGLARWPTVSRSRPSRRRVLATGAASASLLLAGPWVPTGCTSPARAPDGPDPLESPARQAEADVALAQAVAQMADHAGSVLAATARALAVDRMAHARTLRAELRRVQPAPVPGSAAGSAAPPPVAGPPATVDLAVARAALTQALRVAHDEAAGLVPTLPGYRAALLASVAACCATHAALLT